MRDKILLLGLSTGGPMHLNYIFSSIKEVNSHIIIAQHMQEEKINLFANDLDKTFNTLNINFTPTILSQEKKIVICGKNAFISKANSKEIDIEINNKKSNFTPDIDILFSSAVKLCKDHKVYVALLTGMGSDGVKGMIKLKQKGAITMAESKDSAPVFGMPKSAIEKGVVDHIFSLDEMINFFVSEGLIGV